MHFASHASSHLIVDAFLSLRIVVACPMAWMSMMVVVNKSRCTCFKKADFTCICVLCLMCIYVYVRVCVLFVDVRPDDVSLFVRPDLGVAAL